MSCNRRSFIRNGSLLALGSMVSPSALFASELSVGLAKPLSLNPAECDILNFVARYSSKQCLIGATVLAKLRGNEPASTRILAEISSPQKLLSLFSFGPIGGASAEGNLVKFRYNEVEFALENLLVKEFGTRLTGPVFAHDALAYDPITQKLRDPFGARTAGEITLVKNQAATATSASGAAALDAVLRGFIEARETGLVEGAEFKTWSEQVLSGRSSHAPGLVRVLEARMPALAACAAEKVDSVLSSNLVRQVVKSEGLSASNSYERFLGAIGNRARQIA